MSVTDLTGTKWLLNELLDDLPRNEDETKIYQFALTFATPYNIYTWLTQMDDGMPSPDIWLSDDEDIDLAQNYIQAAGLTIEITGGEDATSAALITWLTQNATQIVEPSITDLSGTKWVFNNTIAKIQANTIVVFDISFYWDFDEADPTSGIDCTIFRQYYNSTRNYTLLQYNSDPAYFWESPASGVETGWVDETRKTIYISGGSDATNTTLINWLQENATQIVEPSITDLTNTKWLLNDILTLSPLSSGQYFTVNYTTNQMVCEYMGLNEYIPGSEAPEPHADFYLIYYDNGLPVYVDGWDDDAYRTISITGGIDATNPDLIAWLEANATQIVEPTVSKFFAGTLPVIKAFIDTTEISKIYLSDILIYTK